MKLAFTYVVKYIDNQGEIITTKVRTYFADNRKEGKNMVQASLENFGFVILDIY